MRALWCMLFHRHRWYTGASTYYGVPGFDEGERNESRQCGCCGREC